MDLTARLLGDAHLDDSPDAAAERWASCGGMWLTGRRDGRPLGVPAGVTWVLAAAAERLRAATATVGTEVAVDGPALLGERAALAGLERRGDVSCGGATRLLQAADGWVAVALPRADDLDLLPAWLGVDGRRGVWPRVRAAVARRASNELVEEAAVLGLAVGALGERRADRGAVIATGLGVAPPPVTLRDLRVVDLSSLWAGPLCGQLLALAGMDVIKVESARRPDGARSGPMAFFDLLNAPKSSVVLDFQAREGVDALRKLVATADVVIESSRPRALSQLDIDVASIVSAGPLRVWCSITAHGRAAPHHLRVGFGDDAAVSGGLAAVDERGPVFCADAVADPATGLLAAAAVVDRLLTGGRWLLDVGLARTSALMATGETAAWDGEVARPRARPRIGRAAPLGRDTAAVLDSGGCSGVTERASIRNAEVDGARVDVVVDDGHIAAIVGAGTSRADCVVDAAGGALLPGLHDHHVHLLAAAAAMASTPCGPPDVSDQRALRDALRAADASLPAGRWLRGVGYHESVAGDLDRFQLDAVVPGRPCRVQHRSGHAWVFNSAGLAAVGITTGDGHPAGIDVDAAGSPTGRLIGLDDWLRRRLPCHEADLAAVGDHLARCGVTAVTDATPATSATDLAPVVAAAQRGAIGQGVVVTGSPSLPPDSLEAGGAVTGARSRSFSPTTSCRPSMTWSTAFEWPGPDTVASPCTVSRAPR